MEKVDIGVFGGSGFYSFGDDISEYKIKTPYGGPSSKVFVATVKGKRVAFLPRHGVNHDLPPHSINYRANLWAFKELGVKQVFGPNASGSLQKHIKPGDFVFCDQFYDATHGRKDTFFDGPDVVHVASSTPYCPNMREVAIDASKGKEFTCHPTGTVVVINGPRFASKAESKEYSNKGFEVINMTQYPEVILARELEMCYMNISLITDYDSGVEGVTPSSAQEILEVFMKNNENLKQLLFRIIKDLPPVNDCACSKALEFARF